MMAMIFKRIVMVLIVIFASSWCEVRASSSTENALKLYCKKYRLDQSDPCKSIAGALLGADRPLYCSLVKILATQVLRNISEVPVSQKVVIEHLQKAFGVPGHQRSRIISLNAVPQKTYKPTIKKRFLIVGATLIGLAAMILYLDKLVEHVTKRVEAVDREHFDLKAQADELHKKINNNWRESERRQAELRDKVHNMSLVVMNQASTIPIVCARAMHRSGPFDLEEALVEAPEDEPIDQDESQEERKNLTK